MRTMVEDVEVPKSVRQKVLDPQTEGVPSCNICSLLISRLGLMELNAELKSTNSILIYIRMLFIDFS